MTGVERRDVILGALRASAKPLSGGALARSVGVSRQVVVQDVALLRADDHDIAATNRGYVLHEGEETSRPVRLFKVLHTADELEDELTCVVDLGGEVLDVTVSHRVYGKITAPLHVRSRRDVERYLEQCLDSLCRQTFGDFEAICINDGSTDAGAPASKPPAYPTHRTTNASAKLQ